MQRDVVTGAGACDGEAVLFLDGVGEVAVAVHDDGISVKPLDQVSNSSCCLSATFQKRKESMIRFSDVYAVELMCWGPVCEPWKAVTILRGRDTEMHRFVVHGITRSNKCPSPWVICEYTFGHKDLRTCQTWVDCLNSRLNNEQGRPKNLMVFVHPLCGKGKGHRNWEMVAPIFDRARVRTKVTVTQRAGHAYDIIASLPDEELRSFDGIVAVGGDGLFNEILNGLLSSRHKGSYPPTPEEFKYTGTDDDQCRGCKENGLNNDIASSHGVNGTFSENSYKCDDHEPLLSSPQSKATNVSAFSTNNGICNGATADEVPSISFPNDWFRLGIIPSGSTDAIVLSTTGVRDPVTSALHIVLGRRILLDIAQVVRWRASPSSERSPTVRYAASFAGYGFYGEVIRESENYRWMGPVRYDFAGTMVFLKHRSYEARVAFLETEKVDPLIASMNPGNGTQLLQSPCRSPDRLVCRTNCVVCNETSASVHNSEGASRTRSSTVCDNPKWVWSKGRFLSVGAAVISCRNERAPDGLVADAHLADGFLHLLLIKDCPRPFYLWHLTRLTKKDSNPLNFKFVEHHKTPAFTFVSPHDKSVWNLDGEIFQASEVSVQACRGLVSLFASGPEV